MQYKKSNIIKVTLFGAVGRMGTEVAMVLQDDPGFEIVNLLEQIDHPAVGSTIFGIKISDRPYELPLAGTVFCDFTNRDSALKNAALAAELECPILVGTTGFNEEHVQYLEGLGTKIPIIVAPNLSLGVDLLYRLVEVAAKTVGEMFEVEIIEAHHKWKRDKPSGTAKKIVEILRQDGDFADIPIHSLRLGDIPGEHYILFSGEGETLQIIHRAHSRRAFARGVPPALRFLAHAKPGCYSFRQALEK